MKRFTNCSPGSRLHDPSELKAVLFALLACFLFIGFLTAAYRLTPRNHRSVVVSYDGGSPFPARPVPPRKIAEMLPPPAAPDMNARFRAVPASYENIDFANRSYGPYTFQDGKQTELTLTGGHFRLFVDSSHWFDVRDVFYTDLTGDHRPEAIVRLSHLRCLRSCDGTADLFYIYTLNEGQLKEIWQFETGTYVYGCGLKSFTTRNEQIELELFGRCVDESETSGGSRPSVIDKLTRLEFCFDGERFVAQRKRVVPIPVGDDANYETQIRISDEHREAIKGGKSAPEQLPID